MRPTVDDLARLAALQGVPIPRSDLERLLPSVAGLYEDLDRLRALPIARLEPAFTPEPRAERPEAEPRLA
jgi:hypothetical protein